MPIGRAAAISISGMRRAALVPGVGRFVNKPGGAGLCSAPLFRARAGEAACAGLTELKCARRGSALWKALWL